MDDKELSAIDAEFAESLRRVRAVSLANNFVLTEIVRDLADAAKNRHGYLVGMFERISARADQLPFEKQSHRINDLFREELSKLFTQVATGGGGSVTS
jgi:hypothetical protein